jgi:hypothetical protein
MDSCGDSLASCGSNSTWLTKSRHSPSPHYRHHANYRDLKASAADGCEICCLFVSEVQRTGKETNAIYDDSS